MTSAHAGSTGDDAVEAARRVLSAEAHTERVTTATPAELDAALLGADGRQVVLAGGDGTLHLAVARLRALGRLDLPLALVPLGTGNDLARALGLPLDPAEAAHVVTAFGPRPLDLLVEDGGDVVVNAVHLGVGAAAAEAAGRWKPRLGPLAYPVGAVAAGVRSAGWRLQVVVDGQVVADGHRRALMVAVGNGRAVGGGAPLMPTASPDDGLLDVLVSYATGPFARVRFGAALTAGTHLRDRDVRWARGRRVTVAGEPVGVDADGELGGEARSRGWTVEPGAWSLVRP
ncbi:MAG: diacylglycerol kinase catalytic region [Frankiales bacterium]|nr:diacylglycerol kinase catalytic region [Frankiales bacterium]